MAIITGALGALGASGARVRWVRYTSRRLDFRYIAIDGPIGAGKSALAERLAARLDASLVREDQENPFLADFYADRPGAALQAQLFYLLNRHRQLVDRRQADLFAQVAICDYIFEKDRIYAYLNLDDNELFIYQRLFDLLAEDVPTPDLVIYLQTPTDVLLKRLHARERDPERPAPDAGRGLPARVERGVPSFLLSLHAPRRCSSSKARSFVRRMTTKRWTIW